MALSSFSATWRLDVIRSLLGKQDEDATLTDLANINFSQGDILYHNGSDLVALSPGTSGNFLQTQGAGANPQWAEGASGDVSGPASATDGNVALFDGTTGKLIKDGGTLASIATSGSAADLTTGILPVARFNDTAHGNRSGGSLHAAATTGTAGFMSSSDKTKLDGLGAPITSGTAQSTTSGTAKDFTGIPSGTTMIIIDFDQVTLSGSDNILVQIGDSGGLEASGYTSGSTVNTATGSGNGVTSSAGFVIYQNLSAGFAGHMVLINVTGNAWTASHAGLSIGSGADDSIQGGGRKSLSGTLDRIRVTRTGSNSFNAGQTNVHYM